MIDISIMNIKKAYEEGVDILDGISFEIYEGERVGLLGKNGAGKTTLFRIITGEISADEGEIVIPNFKKTGLISQIPVFPAEYSGEDVLRTAFARLMSIETEIKALEKQMSASNDVQLLKTYDNLAHEFQRLGGYNTEFELNRVINGLRIPDAHRNQPFSSLSGGEKTRMNLARLILENTDILLLDEPTNHLDMRAAEWLEDFLLKYKGTALIISHDRYFLDRTINRAIEISGGKAEMYSGNYSYYVTEKQRRFEQQLDKFQREKAEAKRLNDAADKLQLWGTGNKNLMKKSFAIRKRAERVLKTDKPQRDKAMRVKFSERDFHGDEVLVINDLTKSFGERKLIDIAELEVHGEERIAILGDNGTGKTTLVKLIMEELTPDSGSIRKGPAVKPAYLPQTISFDYPNRTLLDMLIYERNMSPQSARNNLGAFKFSGDDVFKLVKDLSGGEKSRLRLCVLMKDEINLLILDEPTNHLDISSREWIENAVDEYGETLIFISHDRYFVNKFATRIWELDNGVFTDFHGTFSDFRKYKASIAAAPVETKNAATKQKTKQKPKRKAADEQKLLRKLERDIAKLENDIDAIIKQKDEFATDYEKLMELDALEAQAHIDLDALYEEWDEVSG